MQFLDRCSHGASESRLVLDRHHGNLRVGNCWKDTKIFPYRLCRFSCSARERAEKLVKIATVDLGPGAMPSSNHGRADHGHGGVHFSHGREYACYVLIKSNYCDERWQNPL